jgi:hypothetical protein
LLVEAAVDVLPTFVVDVGTGLLPDAEEVFYLGYTAAIAAFQFFDEGATATHGVCPW